MKSTALIPVAIASMLLAGCANTMHAFFDRPVTEDQLITDGNEAQELGTLSVTAQRRLIVGNLKTGHFCSEPPPEAADEVTSAVAAALSTNLSIDKSVNAEFASNFAKHVNQLYKRAHTVQMFRDASFHLCVDAVNSAAVSFTQEQETITTRKINYQPYKAEVVDLVKSLLPSLDKEVAAYYQTEKVRAEHGPIDTKIVVCSPEASSEVASDGADKKLAKISCEAAGSGAK